MAHPPASHIHSLFLDLKLSFFATLRGTVILSSRDVHFSQAESQSHRLFLAQPAVGPTQGDPVQISFLDCLYRTPKQKYERMKKNTSSCSSSQLYPKQQKPTGPPAQNSPAAKNTKSRQNTPSKTDVGNRLANPSSHPA